METNFNTNVGTSLETNHTFDFSERLYKVAIAFVAVLGVVGAGWVISQFGALPQNAPHEISVSGEGKAYVKPDVALISFGVSTQAKTSQDAVNQNNEKMNAVIAAIKGQGVEDKDIQTTLYNLSPVYDYPVIYQPAMGSAPTRDMAISPSYVQGQRVVSGYSLDQQVSVKIRNFDNINAILDKASVAGANTIGQLNFTVDDMEKVQAEARSAAIKKAKEKAKSMVSGTGLRLGKLVNISEGYGGYPQPMYAESLAKDSMGSAAPQIQTGQMEVNITVSLTYQVK
ncbi:MAG: SIMPL domain-containing protein [bacterium]|nr:SIMPL domain-containing protein [bacterium]